MQTFTWKVDDGCEPTLKSRVKEIQFGNGYKQSVADGLNSVSEDWTISYFGDLANVGPAYAFLKAHGSAVPFLWTTPLGETNMFQAKNVSMPSVEANVFTLRATFEQWFGTTV